MARAAARRLEIHLPTYDGILIHANSILLPLDAFPVYAPFLPPSGGGGGGKRTANAPSSFYIDIHTYCFCSVSVQ